MSSCADNTGSNIGEAGGIETLRGISAKPLPTADEFILVNVNELVGPWYLVAVPHDASAVGQPFTVLSDVIEPEIPLPIDMNIVPAFSTFSTPPVASTVETLILFNASRMNAVYTGTDTLASTNLVAQLDALKNNPNVNGTILNLDAYPEITAAYAYWAANPENPQAANEVGDDKVFEKDDNALMVLWQGGGREDLGPGPKTLIAHDLVALIARRWREAGGAAPRTAAAPVGLARA